MTVSVEVTFIIKNVVAGTAADGVYDVCDRLRKAIPGVNIIKTVGELK